MTFNGEANGTPKISPPKSAVERKWLMPLLLGLFIVSTIYFLEGEEAEIVPENVILKSPELGPMLGSVPKITETPPAPVPAAPVPAAPVPAAPVPAAPVPAAPVPAAPVPAAPVPVPVPVPVPAPEIKTEPAPAPEIKTEPAPAPEIKSEARLPGPAPANETAPTPEEVPEPPKMIDVEKLLDLEKMLEEFQVKRQELYTQLEKDYGKETFQKLLLENGKTAIHGPLGGTGAADKMRRKMMLKILEGQSAATKQRSRNLQSGEWANMTAQDSRRMKYADLAGFPTYVWATGGHSAAAAHGNYWRQSYTAVMERAMKDIFATVGLNFIGRNYAMGGTGSGPEIAMCIKEIFGTDIDVLSWDTGMTDGKNYAGMQQYFLRAAMLPRRPVMMALHMGGHRGRRDAMRELEKVGLAALNLDEKQESRMNADIPDTMGLSEEEIEEMPRNVRKFRCGKNIESGDPGCGKSKWSKGICKSRQFRTSWHPGWKWHAMHGNLLALHLSFVLEDSLSELISAKSDPAFPDKLRADEDTDFTQFMNRTLPNTANNMGLPYDIDRELFFRGPNFCHTARLPAEIRHLGILTESSKVGEDSYDMGTQIGKARKSSLGDGPMPLVYDPGSIQNCPVPVNKDRKDAFYVNNYYDWSQLTLPNDAEMKAYGTGEPLRGVLAVCFVECSWGKCPKGNLITEDFKLGTAEMEVNGIKVSGFSKLGKCAFLRHDEGHIWKPNSNGRFDFRARALESKSYIRFSTFAIW